MKVGAIPGRKHGRCRVVGFEVVSGVEADACCIGDFEDIE